VHHASSLSVLVEYMSASVDRSSSWKPSTSRSRPGSASASTESFSPKTTREGAGAASGLGSDSSEIGAGAAEEMFQYKRYIHLWQIIYPGYRTDFSQKGEISFSGGMNGSVVLPFPFPPTHGDRSWDGRLPFTLNVPMRTLCWSIKSCC
jgi:hypothetical protein